MNPGTLVPDVPHFEQVFVDPCVDQRLLKQGLVGLGCTRRHHHTVQVMFFDDLGHLVLGVLGAAEHVLFRIHHSRQAFGKFRHFRYINGPCYIRPAPAHKYTDPGRLTPNIHFFGYLPGLGQGPPHLRQTAPGNTRRRAGINHR